MSSLNKCLTKAGKLVSPADRQELQDLRDEIRGEGLGASEASEQAVAEFLETLELERLGLLDRIEAEGGDLAGVRRPPLFSRRGTESPQRKGVNNPEGRPAAPEGEPTQPIAGNLTQTEKYAVARAMAEENQDLMAPIIEEIKTRLDLAHGDTDIKSELSAIGKANRTGILVGKKRPWFNMEHLRDVFRAKLSFDRLEDMETILVMLDQELQPYGGLDIVKTDTAKMREPGPYGWRMVAFDIRLPNGQIGEFYMAPTEVLDSADESHTLYERWRGRDYMTLSRRERARMERDMRAGSALYEQGYQDFLDRNGHDESAVLASLSSLEARAASVTSRNSLARSSTRISGGSGSQVPPASRNATNAPSAITTRESSLDTNITDESVPLFSRAGQDNQDHLGFFSGLKRAAQALKQAKGTAEQMLKSMQKFGGVKAEELEWTGLGEYIAYLQEQGVQVTKEEITEFLDRNGVQVNEMVLGGDPDIINAPVKLNWDEGVYSEEDENTIEYTVTTDEWETFTVFHDTDAGNISVQADDGTWLDVEMLTGSPLNRQGKGDAEEAIRETVKAARLVENTSGPAKYKQWSMEGERPGSYREIVLTTPVVDPEKSIKPHPRAVDKYKAEWEALVDREMVLNDEILRLQGIYPREENDVEKMTLAKVERKQIEDELDALHARMIRDTIVMGAKRPLEPLQGHHYDSRVRRPMAYLAHFRIDDRIGPNGERILMVQEIQSDLHQRGRDQGYLTKEDRAEMTRINQLWERSQSLNEDARDVIQAHDSLGYDTPTDAMGDVLNNFDDWATRWDTSDFTEGEIETVNKWIKAYQDWQYAKAQVRETSGSRVPDAPFKGNAWVELVAKRIIRMAVERGYDQVAWTPGSIQNERYKLSNFVDGLEFMPVSYQHGVPAGQTQGHLLGYKSDSPDPDEAIFEREVNAEDLHQYIGKEKADELIRQLAEFKKTMEEKAAADPRWEMREVDYKDRADIGGIMYSPDVEYVLMDTKGELSNSFYSTAQQAKDELAKRNLRHAYDTYEKLYVPSLDGDMLEVGGEGMRGFYDKTLPSVFRKIARKLDKGSEVSPTKIEVSRTRPQKYTRLEELEIVPPEPIEHANTHRLRYIEARTGRASIGQHTFDTLQGFLPADIWMAYQDWQENLPSFFDPDDRPTFVMRGPEMAPIYDKEEQQGDYRKFEEVWGLNVTSGMKERVRDEGLPLFSIPEPTGQPATLGALRIALAPAIRGLVGKVQVHIVQSASEVPGNAIPGDVEGVWYPNTDTVYLVADNLHDVRRAKAVLAHEVFGHLAMEEQPEFRQILASIKNMKSLGNAEIRQIADKVARTQGMLDSDREAKEILAVMVEEGVQSSLVDQAIKAIRDFLRRLGLNLDYTEAEIKALIIRAARGLQEQAAAKQAVLRGLPVQEQILNDPQTVEHAINAALETAYPIGDMHDMTVMLHNELEKISGSDDPVQKERAAAIREVLYRARIGPTTDPDYIDPDAMYSRAYHGTRANFDNFDLKYIGSGEGNQAYGWGLYFSSARDIAEWYRGNTSSTVWTYNGRRQTPAAGKGASSRGVAIRNLATDLSKSANFPKWVPRWAVDHRGHPMSVARAIVSMVNRGSDVEAEIRNQIANREEIAQGKRDHLELVKGIHQDVEPMRQSVIEQLEQEQQDWDMVTAYWKAGLEHWDRVAKLGKEGVLYEVEIPDTNYMMDFPTVLTHQPEPVRQILEDTFPELFQTQWIDSKGMPLKDGNELWATEAVPADYMTAAHLYEVYVHMSKAIDTETEIRPKLSRLLPGFASAIDSLNYDKRASLFFRDLGIPGHSFIGATSSEENYVVYDDSVIEIVSKDVGLFSRRDTGPRPLMGTEEENLDMFETPQDAEALRRQQELDAEILRRNRKPEDVPADIGAPGDLFSNQQELFSVMDRLATPKRVLSDDPEIEAMIAAKMATPLEDWTVADRVRHVVQRIKGYDFLNLKQSVIDSAASVEALERGLYGELLDASESSYKAMLATKNLGSVMAAIMHAGIPIYRNGVFMPRADRKGLIQIFEKITQHEEGNLLAQWELYAAAVRAERLIGEKNRDGTRREQLFTPAEIQKAKALGDRYPVFKEVHGEWQKFNSQLLDLAIKRGVINGAEAAKWRQNDYVPFYRAMEEIEYEAGQGPKAGGGVANQTSGIKRLHGSEKPLGNVFENMVMNTAYLIDAIYKNTAMQRIVGMGEGTAMEKIPLAVEAIQFKDGDIARALMKAGLIVGRGVTEADMFNDGLMQVRAMTKEQKEHWSTLFRRVAPRGPNVVHVLQDGKPVYYEVQDPLLLRSIAAMGATQFHGVMNLFRFAKRTLTGAVTIDPAFMAANFVRDTLSTWVVADHGKSPQLLAAIKGAKSAWTQDEDTMQLMMAGAGGGGFYDHNPEDVRKMLAKKMPKGQVNAFANSILTPRGLWRFWQKVGNATEQANRVAVYRRVLAEGGSVAEAAYQARDVLNFTMSGDGEAMKFLVQTVPFLNARVQGLYRLYRGGRDNPQTFAMKGSLIMLATIALLLKNQDDDRYEELPEWDKDTYWHFFVGTEHFRLPKPFEVGALFGTIPERMIRLGSGDDDWDVFTDRMWRMAMDTFSFNPVPQLVKPVAEQYFNRNMFTGNPIIGLMHEGLEPEAQYDPWTSETLRVLADVMPDAFGEWVNSPKRLEAAVRGYFGTVGLYALGAADAVTRRALGHPEPPTKAIQDYPVVSRFWRNPQPRTSKYSSELYDMLHEADALYKTLKAFRDQHRIEEFQELRGKGEGKLATRKYLHNVAAKVRKVNKQIRMVQYNPTMSPEAKKEALDQLYEKKLQILAEVSKVSDMY